jgi:hypothetical protein
MIRTVDEFLKYSEIRANEFPECRKRFLMCAYEQKPIQEIAHLQSVFEYIPESYLNFISKYNIFSMEYLGFQFATAPYGCNSIFPALIKANSKEICPFYNEFKQRHVFLVASYDGAWIVVADSQCDNPGSIYIKHDTSIDSDLELFSPDFETFILLVANLDKLANYETDATLKNPDYFLTIVRQLAGEEYVAAWEDLAEIYLEVED